ncbi:Nn.00g012790.m01.CDS01 [Neocucurbitaria sp. VM-36]
MFALVDSMTYFLGFEDDMNMTITPNQGEDRKPYRLPNGTEVEVCIFDSAGGSWGGGPVTDTSVLAMSAFNRGRYPAYDTLDISERLLNEALANITFAALSLNMWYDRVNGTTSRLFNTYRFENKLSFYLPYGLSLLFTLPVLFMGLIALHQNGVSAIDGGFLHILMTTTGINELRELATIGSAGGKENISQELMQLQVRVGELVASEPLNDAAMCGNGNHRDNGHTSLAITSTNAAIAQGRDRQEFCHNNVEQDEHRGEIGDHNTERNQVSESSQLACDVSTCKPDNNARKRVGFGTLEETKSLLKGRKLTTRYL